MFGTPDTASVSITTMADKMTKKEVEREVEVVLNDETAIKAPSVKKKKKKSKAAEVEDSRIACPESPVPIIPNAGGDRESCLESLRMMARSRYCYSEFVHITLTPSVSNTNSNSKDTSNDKNKNKNKNDGSTQSAASPVFGERISKLTLLRRLCQVRLRCRQL